MNDFTASNGAEIHVHGSGHLSTRANSSEMFGAVSPWEAQALREFFQAEADERLGRHSASGLQISDFQRAARAYFDAHPEPKPWHDAKPGEVWLLTIDGEEMPVRVFEGTPSFSGLRFETYDRGPFGRAATAITAGRRIWPEVAS